VTAEEHPSVGRSVSFWLRHELLAKLDRLARQRGVKRNRVLSDLIEAAEEPSD
jgi:predicted transcriptional regulator